MGVLAAFLALLALGFIVDSAGTYKTLESYGTGGMVDVPRYSYAGHFRPENALNFAMGAALLLLAALTANRASKRRNVDPGVVDKYLSTVERDVWLLAAAAVTMIALGWLAYRAVIQTDFHFSARSAREAFDKVGSYNIRVASNTMYAAAEDKKTQVAHLTPALVRELQKARMGVSGSYGSEYPIPGIIPIGGMLAIAGILLWRRRAQPPIPLVTARHAFLAFGLLNAYVLLWLVSSRVNISSGPLQGFHTSLVIVLVLVMGTLLVVTYEKLSKEGFALPSSLGWMGAYIVISLVPIAWSYRFSASSPGSPAVVWLLAYATSAGLAWSVLLLRLRTERPA